MQSLHMLQAEYFQSPHSLKSAQALIDRKCLNMVHLIQRALPYRAKLYEEQAGVFRHTHQFIDSQRLTLPLCDTRQKIMLLEGRATHAYWKPIAMMAHTFPEWKRVHPHATDPLNVALNIGYTVLARVIKEKIMRYGATPYIGMLHAARDNHEALVYDFEELFRQIAVDAAIIPLFSRNKKVLASHVVTVIFKKLDERIRYRDGFWKLSAIIDAEIGAYVQSLHEGKTYIPYTHSHAHYSIPK